MPFCTAESSQLLSLGPKKGCVRSIGVTQNITHFHELNLVDPVVNRSDVSMAYCWPSSQCLSGSRPCQISRAPPRNPRFYIIENSLHALYTDLCSSWPWKVEYNLIFNWYIDHREFLSTPSPFRIVKFVGVALKFLSLNLFWFAEVRGAGLIHPLSPPTPQLPRPFLLSTPDLVGSYTNSENSASVNEIGKSFTDIELKIWRSETK